MGFEQSVKAEVTAPTFTIGMSSFRPWHHADPSLGFVLLSAGGACQAAACSATGIGVSGILRSLDRQSRLQGAAACLHRAFYQAAAPIA